MQYLFFQTNNQIKLQYFHLLNDEKSLISSCKFAPRFWRMLQLFDGFILLVPTFFTKTCDYETERSCMKNSDQLHTRCVFLFTMPYRCYQPLCKIRRSKILNSPFYRSPSHKETFITLEHISRRKNKIQISSLSNVTITACFKPPVRHGWLLPCLQSDTANFYLASSQTRLTFALPPSTLPPMSRTPCSVVPNVLNIQHLHLRAILVVHCSWMNIAVCKQVSGWLTLDIVYTWKLTYSWTLYHLCDFISIFIKQMSLSHHVWWYLLMWQKIS